MTPLTEAAPQPSEAALAELAGRVAVGLPQNVEQSDLVSYGIFGLIDAIDKFDPGRGFKFETYAISRAQALEPFLNKWVPLPYFRVHARGADGKEVYDRGPSNWARAYVAEFTQRDGEGRSHRLVLAIDTALMPRTHDLAWLVQQHASTPWPPCVCSGLM